MSVYAVDYPVLSRNSSKTENFKFESVHATLISLIRKWAYLKAAFFPLHSALKIHSILEGLCPGVKCSLYVDDFLICCRSRYIHIIERHLRQCLNKLSNWADTNGFKFSTSKTVCVHFCRLYKQHPELVLILNGTVQPFLS